MVVHFREEDPHKETVCKPGSIGHLCFVNRLDMETFQEPENIHLKKTFSFYISRYSFIYTFLDLTINNICMFDKNNRKYVIFALGSLESKEKT